MCFPVAVPGVREDTADPEAGAALDPEAGLVTAGPDPGPTLGLAPTPRAALPAGGSLSPLPGPDPDLSPSLRLGVAVPARTERPNPSRGPGPGADPNLPRPTEPHRSREPEFR